MNAIANSPSNVKLSDAEFSRLASIAANAAGLSIPSSKKSLVQSRVARRMRELGLGLYQDYIAHVDSSPSETRELISALTTNVSGFYRENHHFKFLVDTIVPRLKRKLEKGERIRLWSAGCSSGQEPYTLAMELIKSIPNAVEADILILATDIDPKILERARAGHYSEAEIDAVSAADRKRFFHPSGTDDDSFSIAPEVRRLVRLRELNLHGNWPMRSEFDAIYCRNVVIYFDEETQRALWPRFRQCLSPGGWLMLGHSERIHPLDGTGFSSVGVTIYQKS